MPECGPLDPVCDAAGGAVGGVVGGASSAVFDVMLATLGDAWVKAASTVLTTALDGFEATTTVDLSAAWFRANVQVIATITLPVVVALFVLQVVTAVIRREPGALVRAVVGVGQAMLGTGIALGVTQALLVATDEICAYVAASAGTTVPGAAKRFLQLTWLEGPQAVPMLQMVLGLAVLVGSLMLWAVLLFRKAALVLVAVFAPIAFAGAVWEGSRAWARRWIEAVVALVFCKVVIVVVFVVGMSAFGGTGPGAVGAPAAEADTSVAQGLSDLLVGLLLLCIAICAPWLTWRFVHWSGMETAAALHAAMAASPAPAAVRGAANQAKFTAQWAVTSMVLGGAGGAAGAAGGARPASPLGGAAGGSTGGPPPPPTSPAPSTGGGALPPGGRPSSRPVQGPVPRRRDPGGTP